MVTLILAGVREVEGGAAFWLSVF